MQSTEQEKEDIPNNIKNLEERVKHIEESLKLLGEHDKKLGKIDDILKKPENILSELNAESKRIKSELDVIKKDTEEAQAQLLPLQKYNTQLEEIATSCKGKIETIQNTETNVSTLCTKIAELDKNAQEKATAVQANAESIESSKVDIESILKNMKEINTTSKKESDEINARYEDSSKKYNEIISAYEEIFGSEGLSVESEGSPTVTVGLLGNLKSSFDDLSKEIKKTKEETKEAQENLLTWMSTKTSELEAMLPDAMAAGLSHAFFQKKEEEIKAYKFSARTFIGALIGLCVVSLPVVGLSWYFINTGKSIFEVIELLPRIVLGILPLYIPVFWLASSANKKRNLSKRLIEEYAHREVLAKTFVGLSRHISEHKDESEKDKLWQALLSNIITASAENPGKLITGFNDADHPVLDVIKAYTLKNKEG